MVRRYYHFTSGVPYCEYRLNKQLGKSDRKTVLLIMFFMILRVYILICSIILKTIRFKISHILNIFQLFNYICSHLLKNMPSENHLLQKRINLFDGVSIVPGMIVPNFYSQCRYCLQRWFSGMAYGRMAYY